MELSQKLKELRKKQGLTQLDLAEKLFVSRQAITGWEAGTSRPSLENLQRLSKLYNVPLEILLNEAATAETELEQISEADRPEEKSELEQDTARKGRRYKLIAIIISFLLILAVIAVLTHKEAAQESSGPLSFGEIESKIIDITEDTTEVGIGEFDFD